MERASRSPFMPSLTRSLTVIIITRRMSEMRSGSTSFDSLCASAMMRSAFARRCS
jgi:hypothetical protein